jgi:hypothetical protein
VDLVGLAILFSYPVLDMILCIARRAKGGQPLFVGDRNHMHHRMLRLGLSTRESALTLLVWQVALLCPLFLIRGISPESTPLLLVPSLAVAADRLFLLGRIESARMLALINRRPALVPSEQARGQSAKAEIVISLKPLFEAAQFEEKGNLEPLLDALRCFCERKVGALGIVHLETDRLVIELHLWSGERGAAAALRADWSQALVDFSKLYRLALTTYALPVTVRPVLEQVRSRGLEEAA